MKITIWLALSLIGCGGELAEVAEVEQAATLTPVTSFGANPGAIDMLYYAPAGMPANAPLVMMLHGCETPSNGTTVGWTELADKWKFYVLYPQQRAANNAAYCFNWAGEAEDPNRDTANLERGKGENQSMKEMIDWMKAKFSIDPKRVFVAGFSGGGAQVPLLLATWPDLYAAGMSMAGIPYRCTTVKAEVYGCLNPGKDRTPQAWGDFVRAAFSGFSGARPRIAVWHGSADGFVKTLNQSEIVEQWTNAQGIDATADAMTMVAGKHPRAEYRDASGKTLVETVALQGAGHGWPVDPAKGCGKAGAYTVSAGVCGVEEVGRFFGLEPGSVMPPGPDAGTGTGGDADLGMGTGPGSDGGCGGRPAAMGGTMKMGGCSVGGGGVAPAAPLAVLVLLLLLRKKRAWLVLLALGACAQALTPGKDGGAHGWACDDAGNPIPEPGSDGSAAVDDGGLIAPGGEPYAESSESAHHLSPVISLAGHYGVALAGGHLLASDAAGGSGFPRNTLVSSSGSVEIPAGATVKHALLWYGGAVFLKPGDHGAGDYTPDTGGALDTAADIAANGIKVTIAGTQQGPFDTTTRQPPGASPVGTRAQLSPVDYSPAFGTWTGVKETVWSNRLDVTGLFAGKSGTVAVKVDPPERLDSSGNDSSKNGGNPAGSTTYNLCSGGASWALLLIYESPSLPEKNLVLMDGDFARAWDYLFFHSGKWQRPKVRIDHVPIKKGARFFVYAQSGTPAGEGLPTFPTCSCGCGGTYTLSKMGLGLSQSYFSQTHVDPPACASDPMHRDKTNGPWYLKSGGMPSPISGNDWTLFQSGPRFTELPNLYEGQTAPDADSDQPATNENDPDAAKDRYKGHPWAGRAQVKYHAHGNAVSVVEVDIDPSRVTPGETSSYVYLKGDQKDVWKPQQVVSVKWILFETPL